jgi:hypothetical protein
VGGQDVRGPEPAFAILVAGDDRFSGLKGVARRALEVGAGLLADRAGLPAHSCAHDQSVLVRAVFHDLAQPGLQPFGAEARRLLKQRRDVLDLERDHPEIGEELLLPQPIFQRLLGASGSMRRRVRARLPVVEIHRGARSAMCKR